MQNANFHKDLRAIVPQSNLTKTHQVFWNRYKGLEPHIETKNPSIRKNMVLKKGFQHKKNLQVRQKLNAEIFLVINMEV